MSSRPHDRCCARLKKKKREIAIQRLTVSAVSVVCTRCIGMKWPYVDARVADRCVSEKELHRVGPRPVTTRRNYTALAFARTVGAQSRPEHRYSPLHGRSLRKSARFCPDGFPFRCEKWRVRAAVSVTTHFCLTRQR